MKENQKDKKAKLDGMPFTSFHAPNLPFLNFIELTIFGRLLSLARLDRFHVKVNEVRMIVKRIKN